MLYIITNSFNWYYIRFILFILIPLEEAIDGLLLVDIYKDDVEDESV